MPSEYEMARVRLAEPDLTSDTIYVDIRLLLDHDAEAVRVAEDALDFIEGYGAHRIGAEGAAVRSLAQRLRKRLRGEQAE